MAERLAVLIAESDRTNALWLKSALAQMGMDSQQVLNYKALKDSAQQTRFDVLLLSSDFSGCFGLDGYKKVKENLPEMPVVVCVPSDAEALALEYVRQGARGFIQRGTLGSHSVAAIIQQAYERQLSYNTIKESQRQLDNLISNLPGFVYRCRNDMDWTMEFLSAGFSTLTGYDPEEFIQNRQMTFNQIVHADDRERIWQEIQRAIQKHQRFQLEYRIITRDQQEKWVWEQGNAVTDDPKQIILEGFISDITEKKNREIQMSSLISIGAILRDTLHIEDFAERILDVLMHFYQINDSAFFTLSHQGDRMHAVSSNGGFKVDVGQKIKLDDCIGKTAIEKKEIIVIDQHLQGEKLCENFKIQSIPFMAFIPLSAQMKVLGLLVIGRHKPFVQPDLKAFEAIADMLASALERSNLYQKTERQLKRLESLHAIDQAITSIFDIKVVNKILLDQARKELKADAADILLLNPALNMLEYSAKSGFVEQRLQPDKIALTTSIAGQVLLDNRAISCADLNASPLSSLNSHTRTQQFQAYFAKPLSVKGVAIGVMEVFFRKPFYPDQDWLSFFEAISTQAAVAHDAHRQYADLQKLQQSVSSSFKSTLETWSRSLELHALEVPGHIQRVVKESLQLAKLVGIPQDQLTNIEYGALLHDIGKLGVMDQILRKKGNLTDDEWEQIKCHPKIARDLLSNVKILKDALDIPYSHHENWDGSGYPQGLKGEKIPLPARIFAVVETFDALISDQPYRQAWSRQDAIHYLKDQRGKKFDPGVVDAFLDHLPLNES